MLSYKAAYQFVEGGVHAHVLDFPGAITCGADLAEARRLLASALLDLADPLPRPWRAVTRTGPLTDRPGCRH